MAENAGSIYVLAGTNGAGKSSIAGEMLLASGAVFFNPDEAARLILARNPGISQTEANSAAWQEGKRLLERAIREKSTYAFETTLGGKTIARLLQTALWEGIKVRMWYVGLEGVELHIARVNSRVKRGGHDIPEERIRQRYTESRLHLIDLVPQLTELLAYDNSKEADLAAGVAPEPELILHMVRGRIMESCAVDRVPRWAKPIFATALKTTARK
ncbi:MAG TPA: zeta toxin family protein [Candidatus Acidoferrales bacterium]|nr:zeta toxin family protein [Candidatus Acidoferrales bacterium]